MDGNLAKASPNLLANTSLTGVIGKRNSFAQTPKEDKTCLIGLGLGSWNSSLIIGFNDANSIAASS
ncbi:hypothetical protein GCM10027287_41960 [Bordetella muralis]